LDFISEQEIDSLLHELGITSRVEGDACVLVEMDEEHTVIKHCLCNAEQPCDGNDETHCFDMDIEKMIASIVHIIHKILRGQTVLVPAGKWRSVFDVVAFSMAVDEPWQEFDASATIKLNTRDPLLFENGDEHTLHALITSLMRDGETLEQSVFLLPANAPLLMHIRPGGPVRLWFGSSVLADEVRETYAG
jgi:hypothetical protein